MRRVAVDLTINPNTVARAYREMELRGILDTQHGTGTFVADRPSDRSPEEKQRVLNQITYGNLWRALIRLGLRSDEVREALTLLPRRGSEEVVVPRRCL